MKTKILIILLCIPLIYIISWIYLGYSISKSDRDFFTQWENKEFFENEYKMIIWGKSKINNTNNTQEYLEVYYISKNDNMRMENMILKDIHILKKGDTLIKPSNSDNLFLIKNKHKVQLDYKWAWE